MTAENTPPHPPPSLPPGDRFWISNGVSYAERREGHSPPPTQRSGPLLPSETQILADLALALAVGWAGFWGAFFGLVWLANAIHSYVR